MTYGNQPQRSGINFRIIIAILIAIGGIISYVSKRSVNPVTGETQYVSMSPQQEIALGLQSAPQMASQMGGDTPMNDPRAAFVSEVGQNVVQHSDAGSPKSPYAGNFQFHLLNDEQTINAFALPGGQIFITLGLYEKLQNEAQLAGVLGHETGHVINRHAAQHMAKSQLGGIVATAVGVGASGPDRNGNSHGYSAAIIAQVVNNMAQLRFSRSDESEADAYGLRYMSQAGYDPQEMLGVMQILKQASAGGRQPEFLQTHPLPETRLTEIGAKLKEMFPDGIPNNLTKGRALP